jgi:hypothetical protein
VIQGEVVIDMRGKKTSLEDIYKVMTSYAVTGNYSETARELDMPMTTVEKIVKDNKDNPEFVKLCDEKKKDFAETATVIIDKGLKILDMRMSMALDMQDKLDKLIDEIDSTSEEEMSYKDKISAINLIRETQIQKIKDISTMIGTLYDKRALAKGETTQNLGFVANPETVDKLLEIAGYSKVKEDD